MCFSPSTLEGTVKEGLADEGGVDIRLGGAVVVLGGLGGLI